MHLPKLLSPALLAMLAFPSVAAAQSAATPLDLGLLRNEEVSVVQKVLYSVAGRFEYGGALGVMPFDPYSVAPLVNLMGGGHLSETLGWEVSLGGGWGFRNGTYNDLITLRGGTDCAGGGGENCNVDGIVPEAYRFVSRGAVAAEWAPVYAKLNWRGKRVFHYNAYLLAGGGASLEQSMVPSATEWAVAPMGTAGIGMRVFRSDARTFRLELRDDVLVEHRDWSDAWKAKQNVSLLVGMSFLSKPSGR